MFLPRALSATSDAQNALLRLVKVFEAETKDPADAIEVKPDQKLALDVRDATFEWEEGQAPGSKADERGKGAKRGKKDKGGPVQKSAPRVSAGSPFKVKDINMAIERGTLVAIVGAVGRSVRIYTESQKWILILFFDKKRKGKGHAWRLFAIH